MSDYRAGQDNVVIERDSHLSIGQFSRRSLLSPSAPRLYDQQGLMTAARAAIALRAVLPQTSALSARERALLQEWLDRIAG